MPRTALAAVVTVVLTVVLALAGGCARDPIVLNYADEHVVFPEQGMARAKLYIEFVNDRRPAEEREGPGSFTSVYFPADDEWNRPVTQIYYEALVKDLRQTQLVEVVPTRAEADYVMEVDLLRLGARLTRSAAGYALAAAAGAGLGYVLSQSGGGAIAGAALGIGAMPVPARMHAVTEVALRLTDREREPFWERTCRGEQVKNLWAGVTSRSDQEWVDRYLAVAVKRCNGCLLGQLRQVLIAEGELAPPVPPSRPPLE